MGTPNDRAALARTHLITAAESLRVASARLCDYVEATMGDDATAPIQHCGTEPALSPAPVSSSPPPIPLDAVVEVEGDWLGPYERTDGGWLPGEEGQRFDRILRDGTPRAQIITALYHARRERDAWRDDAQRYAANADFWRDRAEAAERERDAARRELDEAWAQCRAVQQMLDAARRELAAAKDQGLGAAAVTSREAPNSEELDCGSAVASPAPASAPLSDPAPLSGAGNTGETGKPRRWWLVVDKDGDEITVQGSYAEAVHTASVLGETAAFGPYSVVPVIEARVTRETVDRIAHETFPTVRPVNNADMRRFARALGLTVEGDDNG